MEPDRSHQKHEQILAAAQKRFGHYGLSKTTMNDIADDIGMSKASLYYYYKDKESIFRAVLEKEQEHFVQEMKKNIQPSFEAGRMLVEYVNLRLALLKKLITLGKFSYGSYQEVKPLMTALLNEFRKVETKMIESILEIGIDKNEIKLDSIHTHAEFFLDMLHGIRKAALSDHTEGDIIDLPPKKYQKLKDQSNMFATLFIKGIIR